MSIKLKQRGDTIVEVLIATAVVSIVLTGAMAISNNSLKQIRAAQERSEAQAYAQSTVESLDQFISDNPTAGQDQDFCIEVKDNKPSVKVVSDEASQCQFGIYKQVITRRSPDSNVFTVTVFWDGVTGNRQQLTLTYRTSQ
jgi:prepilin-type N-terminal cleavage/methylation domain-containing protein